MVAGSDKRFPFAVRGAGNFANFGPRWFLDKENVELRVSFKYGIGDERVLSNVLREDLEVSYNHWTFSLFAPERMEDDLFSRISAYFLTCHSLWNLCRQNGQVLESAW